MHEQWNWAVGKPGAEPVLLYERSALEAYYGHFHHAIALAKKADSLRSTGGGGTFSALRDGEVGNSAPAPRITAKEFYKTKGRSEAMVVALVLSPAGGNWQAQR